MGSPSGQGISTGKGQHGAAEGVSSQGQQNNPCGCHPLVVSGKEEAQSSQPGALSFKSISCSIILILSMIL